MRSMTIKKPLIEMMEQRFPGFQFKGTTSPGIYGFTRERQYHIFNHVLFQRDFYEGTSYICSCSISCCYNSNWKIYPAFALGDTTDAACLISGKKCHDAKIGWHCYQHHQEARIEEALNALANDMNRYILPWLDKSYEKLSHKGVWKALVNLWMDAVKSMSTDEQEQIISWIRQTGGNELKAPEIYRQILAAACLLPELKQIQDDTKVKRWFFTWTANYFDVNTW